MTTTTTITTTIGAAWCALRQHQQLHGQYPSLFHLTLPGFLRNTATKRRSSFRRNYHCTLFLGAFSFPGKTRSLSLFGPLSISVSSTLLDTRGFRVFAGGHWLADRAFARGCFFLYQTFFGLGGTISKDTRECRDGILAPIVGKMISLT